MVLSECYPDSIPEPKWVTLYNEWTIQKNAYKQRFMTDNERIAKVIWSNSLQRSIQFFGWLPKLTSIKVIENGTSFYLGKLKAWVSIQYERSVNNFSVIVRPDDGGNEIVYHSVSLDNLVPVIDANVKYGTSSYNHICEICGLTPRMAV